MRVDDRPDAPAKKRPQSAGAGKPSTTQNRPIARPSSLAQQQQTPRRDVKPQIRREAASPYPDEAYYRKQAPYSATKQTAYQSNGKRKKGKRKKRTNWLHVIFYTVVAVVAALLVSFLLRTFVFEIVRVSTDAMYPTLAEGDWVLVTKFDYWTSNPNRGDIVSVSVKGENGVIIRRVVGMPGETIELSSEGNTLLEGMIYPEAYVSLKSYVPYPATKMPGARYFVMSDNRQVNLDSRDERVKPVAKNLLNKVRAVVWPLSRRGNL